MGIQHLEIYELIVFIVLGLIILLFGYRIKKIAFFIVWFLLGFNIMLMLMPTLNNLVPQIVGNDLWQNLLPIAGGLLLALLGFSIEKLCVAGICFALVMMVTARYFGTDVLTLAIGAIVGVFAGAAAVMMMKPSIIIATSIAGSYVLTLALLALFTQIDLTVWYWPILIGLAFLGTLFQFSTTRDLE